MDSDGTQAYGWFIQAVVEREEKKKRESMFRDRCETGLLR